MRYFTFFPFIQKSLKFSVNITHLAHLHWDKPHVKCLIVTCGWWWLYGCMNRDLACLVHCFLPCVYRKNCARHIVGTQEIFCEWENHSKNSEIDPNKCLKLADIISLWKPELSLKNWSKSLNKHLVKQGVQKANKHIKRFQHH